MEVPARLVAGGSPFRPCRRLSLPTLLTRWSLLLARGGSEGSAVSPYKDPNPVT